MTKGKELAGTAARLASAADPRLVAAVVFCCIAALGVLGILNNDDPASEFYMDSEGVLPANFSAAVLFFSGGLAIVAGATLPGIRSGWWIFLGLFFCFMGVDEWRALHERIESAAGVNWQFLYLPVIAVGGVAWLLVLRDMLASRPAAGLFLAGALAWVVAQVFEAIQWGLAAPGAEDDVLIHPGLVPPEEILEVSGSALMGLAVLVFLRRRRLRADPVAQPSAFAS